MASAQETNVSQDSQDGQILQPSVENILMTIEFVFDTAKVLLENGRLQDFPFLADRSAELLHGNKILKQILSEITSKCDENTAYEEMQKYMYRLVLEDLLHKSSVENQPIPVDLQNLFPATMEYLVPYSEAIKHELQPEKIANDLKTKLDEYTRCEIDGDAYLRSSDYNKAIQSYEKSLAISTELGHQLGIVDRYHNLASVYLSMEQYEKAIVCFKECLTVSVEIGNQSGIADSNKSLGIVYYNLKKFEESIDYFEKSLDMYTKMENWEEVANTNERLGDVYCIFGQDEKGIDYLKKSLDMYTKLEKWGGIASSSECSGSVYSELLGQYRNSIDYLEKILDMCTKMENQERIANSNKKLGDAYFKLDKYEESIDYIKKSLDMYTKMESQEGIASSNNKLGNAYLELEKYEDSIDYFKKSLDLYTKLGNSEGIASTNGGLGRVYCSVREYEKAITHFEIALRISSSVNDKSGEAASCRKLGDAYDELKRYEKAIFYYKKALEISIEIGDRSEMAHSNANLGNAYLASEKFEKAVEYFEKALVITTDTGLQDEIATIIGNMGGAYFSMRQLESLCLACLGTCHYLIFLPQLQSGLEHLKRSISYFRKSIECYDRIHLNLIVGENQTSFTNQYVAWYVVLKSCFIFFKRFKTALLVADLGKAKTLQVSIEKRSNVTDYARKTWKAIDEEKEKDHISDIAKAIQLEKNCATVVYYAFDWNDVLIVWVLNCDCGHVKIIILSDTLSSKDYMYTSISKLLKTFNLTIDRGSSFFHTRHDVLEDEKSLLQESNPKNRFFRNETSARSEMTRQDLEKVAQRYDLAVVIKKKKSASKILEILNVDKANINEGGSDSSEHLRNLFMALIRPIQEFIKGTKLIIIPDDFLFFAPFSALLDENGVFLSEKYSIQITPSLHTLYSRMLVSESVSLGPALFVGNPTVGSVSFEAEILDIPSLPSATEEVTLLASHFDARPLTGCQAIKSRVLNRISDSSIIHIAAHGDKRRGEIYLSPNPEWIEQGFDFPNKKFYLLQERDIIKMDIKARLVVLCCCATGRGKISSEGVIGLARSFLAAGAQCVLATLWKIYDKGTKLFMEIFYDELLKEVSVCEALKTTMNVFQRHETYFFRSFSIWAPFTIFGKDVRFSREDIEEIKRKSEKFK